MLRLERTVDEHHGRYQLAGIGRHRAAPVVAIPAELFVYKVDPVLELLCDVLDSGHGTEWVSAAANRLPKPTSTMFAAFAHGVPVREMAAA